MILDLRSNLSGKMGRERGTCFETRRGGEKVEAIHDLSMNCRNKCFQSVTQLMISGMTFAH